MRSRSRLDVGTMPELEQALLPLLEERFGEEFDHALLGQALDEVDALYGGQAPGYLASDTPYHDLKHSLDTTLVAARIADGLMAAGDPFDAEDMLLLVLGALFHDIGYLRRTDETAIQGGALTKIHVGRGAAFFRHWLSRSSLAEQAHAAGAMLHYTGYEESAASLDGRLPERHRRLGKIIATADLVSQMADRYYLERCRDALFVEFRLAGDPPMTSAEDLLAGTPAFMAHVRRTRLERELEGYYRYLGHHFRCSPDPYMAAIDRHADFIGKLAATGDFRRLRRDTALRGLPAARPPGMALA